MSWRRHVPAVVVVLAAVAIVAPLMRPGYVLSYDMVFVPRQPITADTLGLGAQTPRAVPSDLLVSVMSHLFPAQVVQKLTLLALLIGAGLGGVKLAPRSTLGRAATGLGYLWTPYLAERLLLGQWAVLIGYATLPWLVITAAQVRERRAGGWPKLIATMAVCGVGGAPALLIAAITVPVTFVLPCGRARLREAIAQATGALAAVGVCALPWLLPAVLRPGSIAADNVAARVFAARSDTRLGVVGSLSTGGGIWNSQVDPPGRAGVVYAACAVLLLVIAVLGLVVTRREPLTSVLIFPGLIGFGVALGSRIPGLRDLLAQLPGGGLLRDSQRYLVPWLLLTALGFGAGVEALRRWLGRYDAGALVLLICVLPVAVLPGVAWGIAGRMQSVDYPTDYARARALIEHDPRQGAVLILPFSTYRAYPWNGNRTSLNPLPRMFDRTVIAASELPVLVEGHVVNVPGDDPLAARIAPILANADPKALATALGNAAVRWVVVDGQLTGIDLSGLKPLQDGTNVRVFEVPTVDATVARTPARGLTAPVAPVLIGDVLALALASCALVRISYSRVRPVLESRKN